MRKAQRPDLQPMRDKTLDEIEGVTTGSPPYDSYLVETIYALRRKPIGQFTVEDLRITLGQKRSVLPLLPLALERLEQDPLVGGHMHPGDLLEVVLLAADVWRGYPSGAETARRLRPVVERALAALERVKPTDWKGGEMADLDAPDEHDRAHLEPLFRAALAWL